MGITTISLSFPDERWIFFIWNCISYNTVTTWIWVDRGCPESLDVQRIKNRFWNELTTYSYYGNWMVVFVVLFPDRESNVFQIIYNSPHWYLHYFIWVVNANTLLDTKRIIFLSKFELPTTRENIALSLLILMHWLIYRIIGIDVNLYSL